MLTTSGEPLSELDAQKDVPAEREGDEHTTKAPSEKKRWLSVVRTPGEVIIVRNRMLYARASTNSKGDVQFGFKHIRKSRGEILHLA